MLDIGCGWGRWMVSAAGAGYEPFGIDLKPLSVAAANRVLRGRGQAGRALVGDLRYLPFCDESFDTVFSYSVLQHLPKLGAFESLREIGRVLRPGGYCLIELPLQPGITNWRHPACYSEDLDCWDVRYYGWQEALGLMGSLFDSVTAAADCIFGIGVKFEDLDILPWRYKPIVVASEGFRRLCGVFPGLVRFSDSIYLMGSKRVG
jgi:SAM-dependent methyltransferase